MKPSQDRPPDRRALKKRFLKCLQARSPLTLRQTVGALIESGVQRELLLAWAVAAGHDQKYAGKLLCECFTALGIRQRRAGAGRRTSPPALLLLAFAQELCAGQEGKYLRAARRAATGPLSAQLAADGIGIIPGLELYAAAIARFTERFTNITMCKNLPATSSN